MEVCFKCNWANSAKDALEKFAENMKTGMSLESSWYKSSDEYKGVCVGLSLKQRHPVYF